MAKKWLWSDAAEWTPTLKPVKARPLAKGEKFRYETTRDKTLCGLHGVAYLKSSNGKCPRCVSESSEPKRYANLVLVSRTQYLTTRDGGKWDGAQGKPTIGVVVSEHIVDTQANIAHRKGELAKEHGVRLSDITVA